MTELEEIKRGEDAKRLIENPLFKDAMKAVRDGIISSLSTSPLGDEKTHNRLAIALQLLNQIEKQLKDHIQTGQMAMIQTDEKLGQKVRRLMNG